MVITDVVKVVKVINKSFGGVVKSLYLSAGECWFDSGYIVGYFNVEGLEGLYDKVVELKLDEVELVFKDEVSIKLDNNLVIFDKSNYFVKVGVIDGGIRKLKSRDISGVEVDLDDVIASGFDLGTLLSENVVMLVDNCVINDGKVVVINPVWVCVGRVNYRGQRLDVSRGLLLSGDELRGRGIKVVVEASNVYLDFGSGVVGISRRNIVQSDVVDKVLDKLGYEDSVLKDIEGLDWVKDWGRSDTVIIWCDSRGAVVGGEVYKGNIGIESGFKEGVVKYKVGEKFVQYLADAEVGVVVSDRILWLRKGDMDLYIGVVKV